LNIGIGLHFEARFDKILSDVQNVADHALSDYLEFRKKNQVTFSCNLQKWSPCNSKKS